MLGLGGSRGSAVWFFALLALGANMAVSIYNLNELFENDAQVDRSRLVLAELNLLLSDVKDAETGQRGFLITDDESYLQPYWGALEHIDSRLRRLQTLSADDPQRQASLKKAQALIKEKLQELDSTIVAHREAGRAAARQIVLTNVGKENMDAIRAVMQTMFERENALLVSRSTIARAKYRATMITTIVGGLLTLVMTGMAFVLMRHELAQRRRVEVELLQRERDLRAKANDLAVAQKATADSLAMLDSFLVNAPIGLAFLDADLRFVRINRHLSRADGVAIDAHIGRHPSGLTSFFTPAAIDDLRMAMNSRQAIVDRLVVDTSTPLDVQRTWQAAYFPVLTTDDQVLGVGLIMRDISSRLQNERALRESQARFHSLAESMPQFVFVARSDGFIEYFNQRWYEYTGLNFQQSIGFRWSTPLHPEDKEQAELSWKQAVESGEFFETEYRIRRSDGAYRCFLGRALPQTNEFGRIVNWFGTCTDIDDRKKAENRLRSSLARFRYLAESIPQMVWTSEPDGEIEYFNRRWIDYTGISAENAHDYGWTEAVHPDDWQNAVSRWAESIATCAPYRAEVRVRTIQDGKYNWHLVAAAPIIDNAGHVVQWVGTLTDIDERQRQAQLLEELVRERTVALSQANAALSQEIDVRKKAQENEREAAEELRRSNRELEQFAYVASHDLQEPLRKIQAFSDRLDKKFSGQLGEQGEEYIDRLTGSATRMRNLINDLLSFSRVATRAKPFVSVDLAEVVRDALVDLDERVAQTRATIDVGPLPRIDGDPTQMRQLFQNLIANALKFHKADVAPVVTIRGRAESEPAESPDRPPRDVCRLEIADNGIGFEECFANRIFQMFQRLHGRNEYEGTGIGLAICRKIVERHSGRISAVSAPGQGSTFVVVLPVRQGNPNETNGEAG
jgi:PAS domain S-box-containing protein